MAAIKDCLCNDSEYALTSAHSFEITNVCTLKNGKMRKVRGSAVPLDSNKTKLKVSFFKYLPSGNYWFLDVAPDYSWFVLGEPCRLFGFIMAKTETVSKEVMDKAETVLRKCGYSTDDMIYRDKTCPRNFHLVRP